MRHFRFTGLLATCVLLHGTAALAQTSSASSPQPQKLTLAEYHARAHEAEHKGDTTLAGQIFALAYQEYGSFESLDEAGKAFIRAERHDLAYEISARYFCAASDSDERQKLTVRLRTLRPDDAVPDCEPGVEDGAQHGDRTFHMGVNLRTDIGTHPFRFDFGVRTKTVDVTLVLDPMIMIDGQHDADLTIAKTGAWSPYGGYRLTTVALAGATHKQHKALVGLTANLPQIGSGAIAGQLGVELSTLLAKHGGGIPTESLFASNGRDFIDLLNFGMFLRFEYGSKF